MKHRICLAWFGEFDAPPRGRSKPKKISSIPVSATGAGPQKRPKVKDAAELRRMFGRD